MLLPKKEMAKIFYFLGKDKQTKIDSFQIKMFKKKMLIKSFLLKKLELICKNKKERIKEK